MSWQEVGVIRVAVHSKSSFITQTFELKIKVKFQWVVRRRGQSLVKEYSSQQKGIHWVGKLVSGSYKLIAASLCALGERTCF